MSKGIILSGMRPTGRLHIGHLSVLENWVRLQEEYQCFFAVADLHALTTAYEETEKIQNNIKEMLIDWLSAGLEPEKSAIFVQSHVPEHAELHLLLSMMTPLSWLERVPTYKDQVKKLGQMGKDINTYGFLGYPMLMSADIMVYRATDVPVGEDQLPHLEFTREVVRRFNHMYKPVFPEPKALLAKVSMLPGVDGRKMSKSYLNCITLGAEASEIKNQVNAMVTDPARIKKTDPGKPEVCVVDKYQAIYSTDQHEAIREQCRRGEIGCVQCKKILMQALEEQQAPLRERRNEIIKRPGYLDEILHEGAKKAKEAAKETLDQVKSAMGI